MNRIVNPSIDTAGVWEEIPIPSGFPVHSFAIQARTSVDVLVSYIPAGTTYWTLKAGTAKSVSWNVKHNSLRLFVNCAFVGTVIEVELASMP